MPAKTVQDLKNVLQQRDAHNIEFCQAVNEVIDSLTVVFEENPKYISVFEQLLEPERVIMFRVPWTDDKGEVNINRGYRVQYNSALGPYKGGLRFHPSVNISVLKFLGFEQILKNSLTTLPMGGGKGGSDFDPKGKSNGEVMRFCQSFMTELSRHIGQFTDVPAGDIGVGGREIGYMFGQYKRIQNQFTGILTGKAYSWGGSLIRPEATGYGAVYYLNEMMLDNGDDIKGKRVLLSGSGNVAQFASEKLLHYGAIPLSLSDSNGTIIEPNGFTAEQLKMVMDLKNIKRGRLSEYTSMSSTAKYYEGQRPWAVYEGKVDVIMPCATQNEVNGTEAERVIKLGLRYVSEGANMPSNDDAIHAYHSSKVFYGPAKASNAGGVATSGLEMTQNSNRLQWSAEKVDAELHAIMKKIFQQCKQTAEKYNKKGNYQFGANVAGFLKVADSMIDQGCV
ncbi:Glutamate dehydrogenase [Spironucleus salmonicida]|uniref:Glutamate dehydrogenase n=1 Tax=Spironucleus salmonicida TaxID=348837 RepID=V6LDJ0_9EUKA|nr:Glutamate dehydrogenase [Spironucleus salmonicida]KAH0575170.1 Glutamate dehydrogenase [Spironucleus salmonicida]|eukprot:EST42308.1 NADP-specific glutamate dehydrogenase [Spironucleus salmonicida]